MNVKLLVGWMAWRFGSSSYALLFGFLLFVMVIENVMPVGMGGFVVDIACNCTFVGVAFGIPISK